MAEQGVQVVFGANISSLLDGLSEASAAVRQGASNMEAQFASIGASRERALASGGSRSFDIDTGEGSVQGYARAAASARQTSAQIETRLAGLESRVQQAGASFVTFGNQVSAGFASAAVAARAGVSQLEGLLGGGIARAVSSLKAPLAAIAGIVGGGALFGAAVKETVDWTGEVKRLSSQLGITTHEASGLAMALNNLGVSSDTYRMASARLQMALRTQEDLLNANQIATRDATSGAPLPLGDVMRNTLDRLGEMREGYDRNAVAMLAFGRAGAQLAELMKLTSDRIEEGTKRAEELGLVVGKDNVDAARRYKAAMADMRDVTQAVQFQVGSHLLPALTDLGVWFANMGAGLVEPIVAGMKFLADVLSNTGFQAGAFVLITKGALIPAFAAAAKAVTALGTAIKVQLAYNAIEGITGIRNLTSVVTGMINPWLMAAIAIGAAVFALERWNSRKERAADRAVEAGKEATAEDQRVQQQLDRVRSSADVVADTNATEDAKTRALRQQKAAIEALIAINPKFREALVYEADGQLNVAESTRRVNAVREQYLQDEINRLKRLEDAAKAEQQALQQSLDRSMSPEGGAPFSGIMSDLDKVEKRLKKLGEERARLQAQQAMAVGAPPPAEGGRYSTAGEAYQRELLALQHRFAAEEVRIRDEAEKAKAAARERYKGTDESGRPESADIEAAIEANAVESIKRVREQRELEHQETLKRYALTGAQERARIEADIATEVARYKVRIAQAERTGNVEEMARLQAELAAAQKAGRTKLDTYDKGREVEDLRMQIEMVRNNNELRLAMEREVIDRLVEIHGEGSEQVIAARHGLAKLERDMADEAERLNLQIADAQRTRNLGALEAEERELARRRSIGEITAQEEIAALRKLEEEKFALRLESIHAQRELSALTTDQHQALYDEELALAAQHHQRMKDLATESQMEIRAKADKYVSPLADAFEGEAAQGFRRGLRGLEDAFAAAVRRMIAQAMAAQLHKLLLGAAVGIMGGGGGGGDGPTELDGSGYGGEKARGGPVSAGKTYLVGEEGPELMTMEASGRIIPTDEVRAAFAKADRSGPPAERWQVPSSAFAQVQRGGTPRPFTGGAGARAAAGREAQQRRFPETVKLDLGESGNMTVRELFEGWVASERYGG